MAGATPTTKAARHARRAVDATINLVPFIDLLSCCIAFLLITAAWTQFQRLSAAPSHGQTGGDAPPAPPAPILTVTRDGYLFAIPNGETLSAGEETLASMLARAHHDAAEDAALTIRAVDSVPYARVAHVMDVANGAGFAALELEGVERD